MTDRIIVIGAGSAGASACFAARKHDRKVEIVCISEEDHPTYSKCALPFVIGGEIDSFETPTVFSYEFFEKQKVELKHGCKVLSVDTQTKIVKTSEGDIEYNKLIVATGGQPNMPELPGTDLDGVLVLHTWDHGETIVQKAQPGMKAVVNGASFIALEVAEALKHRGLDVSIAIRSRALRSMVDGQFSQIIEAKAEEKGIKVLKGVSVTEVLGTDKVTGVKLGDTEVPADLVVMCTGIGPQVDLAHSMGLEIGPVGGIVINEHLETSIKHVYAIGDCVESSCFIRSCPTMAGLGTIATRQGMVAGTNAAGGNELAPPVLNASVMKFFDIEIGAVGPTEDFLKDAGVEFMSSSIKYPDLPHYYPGGTDVHVRLHADKSTGEIISGQVIINKGAAERVNMLSVAILKGLTAKELYYADFCYSPPCSDIWAAEAIAAMGLVKKLERANR